MHPAARVALIVVGLLALAPASGVAQEPVPGTWQEEAERLRRRLEELERWKAEREGAGPPPAGHDAAPPGEPAPVTTETPLEPDQRTGEDLDDLLGKRHPSTDFGGFGIRLTQYGVEPYLHGYVTQSFLSLHNLDFDRRSPSGTRIKLESSFFLSEFAVMVGANIKDTVIPELQLVYETGTSGSGVDSRAIHLRYGQVDLHAHDLLTIRAGKFLIPFGRYNESLYPDFLFPISRLLLRSFVTIVPVIWTDTGVQVRGRYRFAEGLELNYAAYVVNGLRQADTSTVAGVVDDGGSIAAMKANNDIDLGSGRKTFGGRVGFKGRGLDAGLSFAGGRYTPDDEQSLYMSGYYLYYQWRGLSLGTEGALVLQQRARPNGDLHRRGGFAYVAYRFFEVPLPVVERDIDIEPVLAIDHAHLDQRGGTTTLYAAGVQLYFLPKDLPNAKLSFTGGALESSATAKTTGLLLINLSVAF